MIAPQDRWLDQDAGPLVRPYTVTKGRTEPAAGPAAGLIDVVVAAGGPPPGFRPGPEHRQILARCQRPVAVVDLAADLDLPLGVIQVLLGDLSQHGMTKILPAGSGPQRDVRLLRQVLEALRTL